MISRKMCDRLLAIQNLRKFLNLLLDLLLTKHGTLWWAGYVAWIPDARNSRDSAQNGGLLRTCLSTPVI